MGIQSRGMEKRHNSSWHTRWHSSSKATHLNAGVQYELIIWSHRLHRRRKHQGNTNLPLLHHRCSARIKYVNVGSGQVRSSYASNINHVERERISPFPRGSNPLLLQSTQYITLLRNECTSTYNLYLCIRTYHP